MLIHQENYHHYQQQNVQHQWMPFTGMMESVPIPTIIEPAIITLERADSGKGGSDEDSNRFDRKYIPR